LALIASAAFALAVGIAVASGVFDRASTDEPQPAVSGDIEGAAGMQPEPDGDERADRASGPDSRADRPRKRGKKRRRDGESGERVAAALFGPENNAPGKHRCAGSCTGQIRQQVLGLRVHERVADLLTIRSCTSSIGGRATCFAFGGGAYLLGDAPRDGDGELGFCGSSGHYYHVSGPPLGGGSGGVCPGDRERREPILGGPPVAYDCKSSTGGEATCFYFADGSYFVSDPFADGEGELGFCAASNEEGAGSGYYYVSAPSGDGRAGGGCPGTPRRRAIPRPSA
jgi:hypothetical protein